MADPEPPAPPPPSALDETLNSAAATLDMMQSALSSINNTLNDLVAGSTTAP